jgi:hypothetical protein
MPVLVNEITGEVVVVTLVEASLHVEETAPASVLVQDVGIQGPPGPAGPPGGSTYTHVQIAASDTWQVLHNLGRNPAVIVIDSANQQVYGDVFYPTLNEATLTFSAPFSGTAEFV